MSYLEKRKKAFQFAGRGVRRLIGQEAHARIHLAAAIAVILLGSFVGLTGVEWCLIILCIGGVFSAESFNTAIERLADKISPERDKLIEIAKDVAAGGVLFMAIASAIIGLIIFIPKFFN